MRGEVETATLVEKGGEGALCMWWGEGICKGAREGKRPPAINNSTLLMSP